MKVDYLFVYGTLQKASDNDMSRFLSANSELVGEGHILGRLYNVSWYPGAVLSNIKTEKVYGSIFRLYNVEKVLEILDEYEDVGNKLFKRLIVDVNTIHSRKLECWVYLYNGEVDYLQQITSGRFLNS